MLDVHAHRVADHKGGVGTGDRVAQQPLGQEQVVMGALVDGQFQSEALGCQGGNPRSLNRSFNWPRGQLLLDPRRNGLLAERLDWPRGQLLGTCIDWPRGHLGVPSK